MENPNYGPLMASLDRAAKNASHYQWIRDSWVNGLKDILTALAELDDVHPELYLSTIHPDGTFDRNLFDRLTANKTSGRMQP